MCTDFYEKLFGEKAICWGIVICKGVKNSLISEFRRLEVA